jgi:putative N6-adenine-specific DNA methylase
MSTRYRVFAAVAPGLEADAMAEAAETFSGVAALDGGVRWTSTADELWWAVHHLRIPDNLRVRVARFEATDFATLEARLSRVPWHAYLAGPPADVRVGARKSRLNHTGAIEERVRRATSTCGSGVGARLFVRLDRDKVMVSVDASGEPSHKRGWARDTARASMRETLAAGCIRAAGLERGTVPVFDPFCGSGTFLFEVAAVRAQAASIRPFAMFDWPSLSKHTLEVYPPTGLDSGQYSGSDRDREALASAARNGRRLLPNATWTVGDAKDADPPVGAALISNLPYGKRLSDSVRAPVRALTDLVTRRTDLHSVHVVDGSGKLEAISGLKWTIVRRFDNRGLRVRLLRLKR